MTKTANTTIKQYMAYTSNAIFNFGCKMSECPDNCCRNTTWSITVDENSMELYKKMDDNLGKHILECIEEVPEFGHRFKQFDHGHCPLLTDEGLCLIHRDLGESYLCNTCKTYPRIWEGLNNTIDHWLSLSCPNVVRTVLYGQRKITYFESPVTLQDQTLPPTKPFDDARRRIRDELIEIVQYRKFSIKEKLLFMGLFMRSLSRFELNDNFNNSVEEVITNYRSYMKKPDFFESLLSGLANADEDSQKHFFSVLSAMVSVSLSVPKKIPEGVKNAQYYERMANLHKDTKDKVADEYLTSAFNRLIVPYVNGNKYVFDNYLAYSLVSSRFLVEATDFPVAYAGFIGEFLAMLIFTAGLFKDNETLTDDDMITGIYLFHRKISHTKTLRKTLSEVFSDDLLAWLLNALGDIK